MRLTALSITTLLSFSISVQATPLNWLDWFGFDPDSIQQRSGGSKDMEQFSGVGKGHDPLQPSVGGRKSDDPVQQLSGSTRPTILHK
jgi:hypothetical protein